MLSLKTPDPSPGDGQRPLLTASSQYSSDILTASEVSKIQIFYKISLSQSVLGMMFPGISCLGVGWMDKQEYHGQMSFWEILDPHEVQQVLLLLRAFNMTVSCGRRKSHNELHLFPDIRSGASLRGCDHIFRHFHFHK